MTFYLPKDIQIIINDYTKPLTRTDWKTFATLHYGNVNEIIAMLQRDANYYEMDFYEYTCQHKYRGDGSNYAD